MMTNATYGTKLIQEMDDAVEIVNWMRGKKLSG